MTKNRFPVADLFWGMAPILLVGVLMIGVGCAGSEIRTEDGVGLESRKTSAGEEALPGLDGDSFAEGQCRAKGPGGTIRVNPECIRPDMAVRPGLTVSDLGSVAIVTFESVGQIKSKGADKVSRVSKADMEITDTVARRLLDAGIPLVERDRAITEKMLQELNLSTSDLIDASSAPFIGHQLGVRTLIIGRYEFSGEASCSFDNKGVMIIGKPERVDYQSVRIKALDVEKGVVLIDVKFSMTGKVADILLPHVLARYSVKKILERLDGEQNVL